MIPKSVRSLRIDINSGQVRKSIAICQQDSIMPTINAMLVEGGKALDLTEVLWAEIFIHKADGYEADNGCVIDGDSIQYSLHSSDVSAVGINTAQFQLTYKDGRVITTPTFEIVVYQKVLDQRVQQSFNEYTSLSQMVVQANAYNEAAAENATNAAASATSAENSATSAATSDLGASLSATSAASSASDAAESASAAAASATEAASSATAAATSATNAASSASSANNYKITTVANAALAQEYASDAKNYRDAAAASATSAAASAASIGNKVEQASASATAAAGSAAEASGYLATVKGYADAAEASATAAESASSSAFTYAEDCEAYKDAAATSASTATTKASNAADSATAAAGSASTASTKASEASTSASNASGSATAASSSATDAAAYSVDAKNYKDSAEYYAGKAEEAYEKMGEQGLVLGETSTTAYRGDRGKTAYDDSQANKTAIGTMANLNTTEKGSLVGAICEVKTEAGTKQNATDNSLNTTSKTIPGAINELLAKAGAANGIAELDANGKVPSSQLPSFVDDVIEGYLKASDGKFYKNKSGSTYSNVITGETGKIYVDKDTDKTYRWSGSVYAVISDSIALGETSSTAYRGDRGKTAYDDSQTNKGNIGTMANLTTTEKGSLVGAINELVTTAGTKQAATDNSLNTTSKQIVGAINELESRIATLEAMIGYPISHS